MLDSFTNIVMVPNFMGQKSIIETSEKPNMKDNMQDALKNNDHSQENPAKGEIEGNHHGNASQQIDQMRLVLKNNLSRQRLFMMQACIHCGICAEACHYYCSTEDPDLIPANKLERVSLILEKYFHPFKLRLSFWGGKRSIGDREILELFKTAYESCTLCGKCALTCPMGINTGEILYIARAMLCSIGRLPAGLMEPVKIATEQGNFIGMSTDDFIDTIEWIGEEMEDEINVENFSIPIDKEEAEVLYIPHPVEIRDWPLLVMYPVKIFNAAGEDYTLSSYAFDPVNYAYYQGSKDNMMRIAQRKLDAREKLKAKSIVLAPCGHGYRVLRWEAEKCLGKRHSFPVLTMVELIDHYIQIGRIQLEKETVDGPVTFHDPCNIARRGGVVQAPRNILNALTSHFVEMQPNGARNFCCGGGGGLGALTDYAQKRITMGKTKVDQILQTGAKIVVTSCFNCMTQIRQLVQAYDLGVEVKSIVEIVSSALKS